MTWSNDNLKEFNDVMFAVKSNETLESFKGLSSFGDRLKFVREFLAYDLDEFSTMINFDKDSLLQVEKGECELSKSVRLTIYNEFDVNPDWLKDNIGAPFRQWERVCHRFKDIRIEDLHFTVEKCAKELEIDKCDLGFYETVLRAPESVISDFCELTKRCEVAREVTEKWVKTGIAPKYKVSDNDFMSIPFLSKNDNLYVEKLASVLQSEETDLHYAIKTTLNIFEREVVNRKKGKV